MNRIEAEQLLRAGLSDRQVARQLHVDAKAVGQLRAHLGLPKARPGRKTTPVDQAFAARLRDAGDGHREWTGSTNSRGTPTMRRDGENVSAYRVAWRLHHDRPPVGNVLAVCGHPGCIAPDHLEDRTMRERGRALANAVFGDAS